MLPPKSLSATKPKKWAPNLYELDSDLSEPDAVPGEGATDSEFFHQRFRNFLYVEFIGPRKTLLKLRNLCLDWLQPEIRTKEEIIEVLVLEQYLSILPERIKPWVYARKPETCEKLVALLEDYEAMYEPEDDNSSDTHSEGGMSRRAAESPPPRPALPCCSDCSFVQGSPENFLEQQCSGDGALALCSQVGSTLRQARVGQAVEGWQMASSLRRRPQDPGHRESLKREGPLEGGGPTKARPACARPQSRGARRGRSRDMESRDRWPSVRSPRSRFHQRDLTLPLAERAKEREHRRRDSLLDLDARSEEAVLYQDMVALTEDRKPQNPIQDNMENYRKLLSLGVQLAEDDGHSHMTQGHSARSKRSAYPSTSRGLKTAPETKKSAHRRGICEAESSHGVIMEKFIKDVARSSRSGRARESSERPHRLSRTQPLDFGAMPYVCDECGRSFAVISEFVEHQIVHTRESLYEYGESFIHSAAVSEAQSRPEGARRSEGAQAAGLAEHRGGQAQEHLRGSGDEEQDEPFLPSPTFSELQKMYGKDKFYECKVCKETFLHSSALIEHQKIHSHEDREKERSTGAVRRTPMLGELQRACGKEKRYECKVCGETFHHSAALREHQKTHSRGSPSEGRARAFEETFIPGQSLKRRQKTYSKEKLYDFREGGDAFGRSSDFMEHQKIHSRKGYFDSRGYEKPLLHSMSMPGSQKSHTITRPPEDEDEEKAFTASSSPEDGQEARGYERSAYERAILHSLAAFRPPRGLREDGEPSTYLSGLRDPPQKTPAWESPYAGGRHSFFRSSVFYRASRPAPLDHLAGEGPSGWQRDGEASGPSSDGRQHQKARAKKKNIERKNYDASMMHSLHFGESQTFRPRERFYECLECGEFFVRSSELAEHQKIHNRKKLSGSKNYLRSVLRSLSSTDPQTSYQGHYCEQPVLNECKECGECFATVEDLGRHQKIYAREKFHDGKLFGEPVMQDLGLDGSPEEELEEQEEPEEPEDSIYGCKDCGLGFADRADLRDHQKVHGREYLVDSREYTHPAVHMPPVSEYQKDCLGEQLYECPACGESFVHSSFLFEHQKVHEQDQFYGHRRYEPFMQPLIVSPRRPQAPQKSAPAGVGPQCQVCGQDFIPLRPAGLYGEGAGGPEGGRPDDELFKCDVCGQLFSDRLSLARHQNTHTG
nr:PREDICTED: paternally-expressed gene 3 protein [Bos mutus]